MAMLIGCADFPEKYENVIEGQKIRPFAIILEPPEAAPGDTVKVSLKMYDADKNYTVDWELALKYQIDNYDALPQVSEIIDLEAGDRKINPTADGLEFSFVIPKGSQNPLSLSELTPELLRSVDEISSSERAELELLGISDLDKGLKKKAVIELVEGLSSIPNELSPIVDNLVALIQLKAKVTSTGFKLNITKNLSVRYSNQLGKGSYLSNVNQNPRIDSLGIIRVHKAGITDINKISKFVSDTVYLNFSSDNVKTIEFDTIEVREDYSYFAFAKSLGSEQVYRSPDEKQHTEVLFYQWFYTNLDDVSSGWEDLLKINYAESPQGIEVVALEIPKNKEMKRFTLRSTCMDWRLEWNALASRGLDHKIVYGYFDFKSAF